MRLKLFEKMFRILGGQYNVLIDLCSVGSQVDTKYRDVQKTLILNL